MIRERAKRQREEEESTELLQALPGKEEEEEEEEEEVDFFFFSLFEWQLASAFISLHLILYFTFPFSWNRPQNPKVRRRRNFRPNFSLNRFSFPSNKLLLSSNSIHFNRNVSLFAVGMRGKQSKRGRKLSRKKLSSSKKMKRSSNRELKKPSKLLQKR